MEISIRIVFYMRLAELESEYQRNLLKKKIK